MKSMGSFYSFASILEQKIRQDIQTELRETPQFPSENGVLSQKFDSSPLGLAWMMGQLPRQELDRESKGVATYSRYKAAARPRPAHKLTEIQCRAYETLRHYVSELSVGFTQSELKKAYRKAVLIAHPDRGGSSAAFQKVRDSYKILVLVF